MRTELLRWLIETAVPFLNTLRNPPKWPLTLSGHRSMPNGTLGKDVASFLDNIKLELLPKYEVHDTLHVLLGYGTSPLEEMKLQAFMIGNRSATFSGKGLFVLGLIIKPEYWKTLQPEIKKGREAQQIAKYNFAELINERTDSLRNRMNIRAANFSI